jgi:hypothetical protein
MKIPTGVLRCYGLSTMSSRYEWNKQLVDLGGKHVGRK